MGGMGIYKPVEECQISSLHQRPSGPSHSDKRSELAGEMKALRADVDKESDARSKAKLEVIEVILQHAPLELKLAVRAASEKGASSWVTASPSFDHGTVLHKASSLTLATSAMTLLDLPVTCACG